MSPELEKALKDLLEKNKSPMIEAIEDMAKAKATAETLNIKNISKNRKAALINDIVKHSCSNSIEHHEVMVHIVSQFLLQSAVGLKQQFDNHADAAHENYMIFGRSVQIYLKKFEAENKENGRTDTVNRLFRREQMRADEPCNCKSCQEKRKFDA